jgi:hypothetical protein
MVVKQQADFFPNENGTCALLAAAIATNSDFDKVHKVYADLGRKDRRGVDTSMILDAIDKLGFNGELINNSNNFTVKTAPKRINGNVIMITRNHAISMVDGEVNDWTKDSRYIVKEYIKVTPKVLKSRKSRVMKEAWRIAKIGAENFGGTSREYLSVAMKEAWATIKA